MELNNPMPHSKRKVLIFTDWFLPGFKAGGPIQSIANLVAHCESEFNLSIVTRNNDFDLKEVKPYPAIIPNTWMSLSKNTRVYYHKDNKLSLEAIKDISEEKYDTIYFNSLFSIYYTWLPLFFFRRQNAKLVLAPRGMLGAGALAIKATKKILFLSMLKALPIRRKIIWHATSEGEQNEIKNFFGINTKVVLAPNLPPRRSIVWNQKPKSEGALKLFFLSRISQKKNLKGALEYLTLIPNNLHVEFNIIGPIEDAAYWAESQRLIEKITYEKPTISIHYLGAINHDFLPGIIASFHAMLLPSFNENFGHVILDALAASCPVILSDQTPWLHLTSKSVGWDIPLNNPHAFGEAIATLARMDQAQFDTWSLSAFNEAYAFYNNPDIINQTKNLFQAHGNE